MNFEQARENMIKQQIRTENVVDDALLDILSSIPRDQFVPEAYRELAYADMNIPLSESRSMLTPSMEAILLDALAIEKGEHVLEIGTGCAYLTALLYEASGSVVTLDDTDYVRPEIRNRLAHVNFQTGDAMNGWQGMPPVDVIVLNGSIEELPDGMLDHLKPGGRMFAILGDEPVMTATLISKDRSGNIERKDLLETSASRLPKAETPEAFSF